MVTALTKQQSDVLCAFEGFGRLDAPVWFLGMEEAGDNPALLHTRAKWQTVMDLKEAHRLLGIHKHHEEEVRKVSLQPTWRPMCVLMVLGQNPELYQPFPRGFASLARPERVQHLIQRRNLVDELRRYQSQKLGRSSDVGETFLCELFPVPKPSANSYSLQAVLPQWSSHAHYKSEVLAIRKQLLMSRLARHRPRVVVAYGKAFWDDYRELFSEKTFRRANEHESLMLPSWTGGRDDTAGDLGNLKGAEIAFACDHDHTLVILTPHLTRINDYARLSELADFISLSRANELAAQEEALAAAVSRRSRAGDPR